MECFAKSKLNKKAYSHAKSLIDNDKIDTKSRWSFNSSDENKLLGEDKDDWDNYAKWFLLINEDANKKTKDYYKFPYGKNDKVYKSGLNAIRQRASQFGYDDVFEAAGKLLDMIAKKEDAENKIKEEFKGVFEKFLSKI